MLNLVLRLVAIAACVFGVAICARISGEVLRDDRGGSTIITTYIDPATGAGDIARENPRVTALEQQMPGVVAITTSPAWPHSTGKAKAHSTPASSASSPESSFQPTSFNWVPSHAQSTKESGSPTRAIAFPFSSSHSPWKMVGD
ncbi:hypothetical protein Z517_08939 [Fonsecaea pedrosoi CBS 271.37]|uniref:Uncharacterized protein n=1 Tax=Fonsecaea pedrosoi CBS 271.37 TaxID=1442368 RepID=A0A0D2H3B5_9EURO|nr:uncharacterized protein Z517_08939 [Fonsecaea pedrosoi CBS 271.37]KIW79099.1 hypothetical protein Z517_08939 [Fonsecaea pedrosoi CBS 271.37]